MAQWRVPLSGFGMPSVVRALRRSELPNTYIGGTVNGREMYTATEHGFISFGAEDNVWALLPMAMNLPTDNFEVLLRTKRIANGSQNYINTGSGLYLSSQPWSISAADAYYIAFGAGSSASKYCVYRRAADGTQSAMYNPSASPLPTFSSGQVLLMRVRRQGTALLAKAWVEGNAEPAWQANLTDSNFSVSGVAILTQGYKLAMLYTDLAIATNGDTAVLSEPVVTISGTAPAGSVYAVCVRSAITGEIAGMAYSDEVTGAWQFGAYTDEPLYAEIDCPGGPLFDYVFARGSGFLAGQFPGGITTVKSVPTSATIRILLREAAGHPLDGAVIAEVQSAADGTWQVDNLNPALKFDVVGRKQGFRDVILPGLSPKPY